MNDRMFQVTGDAYDSFMGRWSRLLAPALVESAGVTSGQRVLDVGCGPGALTGALVDVVGVGSVSACDPSAPFVDACAERHPGVDVKQATAEDLPWPDQAFDAVLASLVLNFVADRGVAAAQVMRVLRPGGTIAATVWDYAEGMEMLRHFWDSARAVRSGAPDEGWHPSGLGGEGELADFLSGAGFEAVAEGTLRVESTYADSNEVWQGFLAGVGPAGAWCLTLPEEEREAVRREFLGRLPQRGPVTLAAVARCGTAVRSPP